MKTMVCIEPGHFEYKSAAKPKLTKGNSIIKIKRIGICGTDLHAYEGTQPYFEYPRILGHELAGELVAADDAPGFKIGEAVTFIPYFSCGKCIACRMGKPNCCSNIKVCGVHQNGGMSEYLSVPSSSLVHGDGLSFTELALVEPLSIGVHGVKRANIIAGEYVLIVGAGPIGLGAMEFARISGANVIALDVNESRLTFCKDKLHIEHIINGKKDNILNRLLEITNGDMPSLVIDATGNLKAIKSCFQYMAHGGRFVLIGLQKEDISFSHPEFHKREATLMSSRNATRSDFEYVINAIKKKWIYPKEFITQTLLFENIKTEFVHLLNAENGVVKAMVEIN